MRRVALATVAIAVCFTLAFCGGGGGGSSFSSPSNPSSPPPAPALSITSTTLPEGVEGKTYTAQLQATGGTGTYTWAGVPDINAVPFPSWLTIDSKTGALSGTIPSANPTWIANSFNISVKVSDAAGQTTQKNFTLQANAPLTTHETTAAEGTTGITYHWGTQISGGHAPFTVSVDSGAPNGLQITSDNQVWVYADGTPTQAGNFTAQVRIKDSASPAQEVVVALAFVIDSKLAISSTRLKAGVVGRAYADQILAANGTPPLTWSAQNQLPSGLTADAATGKITGTPTTTYGGSMYVTVKDSSSPVQTASGWVALTVYPALAFQIPNPFQTHIQQYFFQPMVGGGMPPVTTTVTGGSLPPGMKLDSTGTFGGTPTQVGTYSFILTATDSDNPAVTIQSPFTFTVLPPLPVIGGGQPPAGALGKAYSFKLWARDGTPPYTWSTTAGQLPPGLTMQSDGTISGTPTAVSSYGQGFTFTAAVTDSASPPQTATSQLWIAVFATAKGRNDSIATASRAGPGGVQASLSPFADPPGSTTSAPDTDYYKMIGKGSGTVTIDVPSTTFVDPVIEILDANGQRYKTCKDPGDDKPTLTFIVKDTTPDAFDDECVNDDIDPTVNRSAHLDFQVPGAAGTLTTFYVHVFDSSGNARPDMQYSMNTSGDAVWPMSLPQTALPVASVGKAYAGSVNVGDLGAATVTYQLVGGALPPGLSFASLTNPQVGSITGTPTAAGTYTFTVQATSSDTPPQVATQTYGITVYDPLTIPITKLPDLKAGMPYSYFTPVSGGIPPYQFSNWGSGWCCLQLNGTTGEWTGTYTGTTTQTFTTTITVLDSTGRRADQPVTLTVSP